MKTIKKILIVKTSSMGDIIHTLPAITDAGYALPTAEFHWVIEKKFSQIPTWHPKIKKIIPVNFRSLKKKYLQLKAYKEYFRFLQKLKNNKYDIIVDAQGLIKSSFFITFFAKGEKHGMDYNSIREPIASLCYQKRYKISKKKHTVERIRQLFSYSLKYPTPIIKGKYCIQQNFKIKKNIAPYFIFLYNTTHVKKHWPESNWNKLIQKTSKLGFNIKLPYWSKNEQLRTKKIIYGLNQQKITILHQPTLDEIAKQIVSAHAIISIDTGLSHLSAALSRPILTLYGPTDPKIVGIYGHNKKLFIKSKTKNMNDITTKEVWDTFQKLLNQI